MVKTFEFMDGEVCEIKGVKTFYHAGDGDRVRVFLNGIEQKYVIWANLAESEICSAVYPFELEPGGTAFRTVHRYGDVHVEPLE